MLAPAPIVDFYNANSTTPGLHELMLAKLLGTKMFSLKAGKKKHRTKVCAWWVSVVAFFLALVFSGMGVLEASNGKHGTHREHSARTAAFGTAARSR